MGRSYTAGPCASHCPNTRLSRCHGRDMKTRVSPKTTATLLSIASRSQAQKTTPTSFLPHLPCTCLTSREFIHISFLFLYEIKNPDLICNFVCFRPAVVEDDLKMLFASSGALVKNFKFFQ